MAQDRYEREERYGRRHGSRSGEYGNQRRGEFSSHNYGNSDPLSDYDRAEQSDWRTDDLDYPSYGPSGSYRDQDRYGAERGRYEQRRNDRFGRERGLMDRAGDEVASWFGDEEAASRRRADQFRGKGPKGYTRADERIEEDVNDRLTDDPWLDASDIDVAVASGEVTLAGEVSSRQDKRRAEDCAEMVSGVTHVQNNLRVRSSDNAPSARQGETF
ncbi:BON domain-containing protein (plasmid) [Ensifer adhaerens]|uniref:BON domain-containing protein n=1 Tax=Ensifer adhaerens TaxID=106592 RepID=UPI001CBFC368|nr:BON domain-containing protein [Ensifer adhaerens]MBZ7927657.1 BON domain-containing protein [Ensifer adhaerens]UAX98053.1 BON domain-containing protein [Ensifer adhaerens]UAY05434.1 BON domain-containing protein [Ensifer adhaerens]UAY12812.1 BON domain-containing protein [Ensifer adhaerens]